MPRLQMVIISDDTTAGEGTENDPVRTLTRVHTTDGRLIASEDPCIYEIAEEWEAKYTQAVCREKIAHNALQIANERARDMNDYLKSTGCTLEHFLSYQRAKRIEAATRQ